MITGLNMGLVIALFRQDKEHERSGASAETTPPSIAIL